MTSQIEPAAAAESVPFWYQPVTAPLLGRGAPAGSARAAPCRAVVTGSVQAT